MSVQSVTHINFSGDAKSALQFYHSVFGGDLTIITYEDANNIDKPDEAKQVMWGQVRSKNGFCVMAYDVPSSRPFERGIGSFYVSVRGDSEEELKEFWSSLSADGQVIVNLSPAAWSPLYGMVIDQFGITWVLDIATTWEEN